MRDAYERVNEHQLQQEVDRVNRAKYEAMEAIHITISKLIKETGCTIVSLSCIHSSTLIVELDIK